MQVSPLVFAFAAMFCWGFGDFLIQKSVRKVGDTETLAMIGITGMIGLLPFIVQDIAKLNNDALLFLGGIGVVTFGVAMLNFEALKRGKLSVVEVMLEVELPITVFLGLVFLSENLSLAQFAAIAIIFVGIILMATRHLSISHFAQHFEKGAMLALAAGIGMGIVNFLTGVGSKSVSPLMVIWIPWIAFTALCLAYLWEKKSLHFFINNAKKHGKLLVATGIFDTLAWLFFALAVTGAQISITIGITESYPAVAMFLGMWLNGEKIQKHQAIGGAIAVGASILLAML